MAPELPRPSEGEPTPDPEIFKQFIENQSAEMFLRRQELELRQQEIDNAHEYALKLLDAQLIDRQHDREHNKATSNTGCILVMFLFAFVTAGIAYALFLGKDTLVMEAIKAIGFTVSGGLGGYSIKVIKAGNEAPKE